MIHKLTLVLAIPCVLATTAHAGGTRLCPPVDVGNGDICDCVVHNYGVAIDTDVVIELQGVDSIPLIPQNVSPGTSVNEAVTIRGLFAQCGCVVRGASKDSRVSLSVLSAFDRSAEVTVPCD
jgi:hypothetical protein